MFKCEWCEEEYDPALKFMVVIVDPKDTVEKGICCPDCISNWFAEDPENIASANIIKVK